MILKTANGDFNFPNLNVYKSYLTHHCSLHDLRKIFKYYFGISSCSDYCDFDLTVDTRKFYIENIINELNQDNLF